jgi:hypothetical protein
MKLLSTNNILLLILFIGGTFASYADLSLEGHYQGKNLFIQNPEDEDGFGFCVTGASVNGESVSDGIESSAFEINFEEFNIKIGDPVFIVLDHGIGCKPKILNPEVLLPKSTYEIQSISCTPEGKLNWGTTSESGKLAYVIEQYRWNKWVVIGEVDGIGTSAANEYNFNVTPHSGENKIRVAQTDHTGKKRPSKAVTFANTTINEPEFNPKRVRDIIKFSASGKPIETKYEIYDAYGNIVKKGVGSQVDCSNLKKGAYYINYDNKNEKFIKA